MSFTDLQHCNLLLSVHSHRYDLHCICLSGWGAENGRSGSWSGDRRSSCVRRASGGCKMNCCWSSGIRGVCSGRSCRIKIVVIVVGLFYSVAFSVKKRLEHIKPELRTWKPEVRSNRTSNESSKILSTYLQRTLEH